jgi:hypothetical protein
MFSAFEGCPSNETEAKKKFFINHLGALQKQFHCVLKTSMHHFEWVINPFTGDNISGLTTCTQELFTDISCDGSLKDDWCRKPSTILAACEK